MTRVFGRSVRLALLASSLLVAGAATQGLAPTAETWPSWLMLAGGLYLVLRR